MSEKLRVELEGDSEKLEKSLKSAINQLDKFDKAAGKSLGGIEKPIQKAGRSFNQVGKKAANATPTLVAFGQGLGDVRFGINGVANNIEFLTQSFGNLRQQTGSTRGAFKALLSGLAGPGGLLIAVATVTNLLAIYGDSLFRVKSQSEKLAEATEKAAKKLDNYAKSLDDVTKAQIKGEQSAQKEIITLSQLRGVAEDVTRSNEDRLKAVQELRRLFPEYFKDLSNEKILTGNLSGVYDQLTQSILKRARATAATNILVKNAEREILITQRLADVVNNVLKLKEENARIDKNNQNNRSGGTVGGFGQAISASTINSLLEEGEDLRKELERILGSKIDLAKIIEENGGIDLSGVDLEKSLSKLPTAKVNIDLQPILDFTPLAETGEALRDKIRGESAKTLALLDEQALRLQENLLRFNNAASDIVTNGIGDTFAQLGQVIGESLVNGGNLIEKAGGALLGGLGSILVQLGKQAIAIGVGIIAVKLALKSLGGAGAIAAGVALVALGSAFSSGAKSLAGNFGGGGGSGGSGGSFSQGGSSSSNTFSSSSGGFGGTVVFEIAGTKLVGVLNRTLDRNAALGGANLQNALG